MKLVNFLEMNKIPYFKINITIINGKKKMSPFPSGWNNLSFDKCMEMNKKIKNKFFINVILKDSDYMVIDIDSKEKQTDYLEKYGDVNKTKSTGKGLPHLWRKKHDDDKNEKSKIDTKADLDLLYLNVLESIDAEFENYNQDFPIFNLFPKIEEKKKITFKPKKTKSLTSNDSGLSINMNITEEQRDIIDNISIEYIDNYQDWLKIIWGLNNSIGDFNLIKEVSMRSSKYTNDEDLRKYLDDDTKKLMTFGTICYYSKLSNKEKYLEIKAKHTELFFDHSDYNFAEIYVKNACDNIVLHGDSEYKEFYFFKDNFWVLDTKLDLIKKDMRDILFNLYNRKRKQLVAEIDFQAENENMLKMLTASIKCINTSSKQK